MDDILGKCKTYKRGPLIRTYPKICTLLEKVESILESLSYTLNDFEWNENEIVEKVSQ